MIKKIAHWLVLLAAMGCTPQEKPSAKRTKQIDAASASAAKPPSTAIHTINGNQLLVVDVLSADGRWVDHQKCYVWRDAEYKTASVSCPSEQNTEPVNTLGESEKSSF